MLDTRLFQQDVPQGWEPGEKRLRVCAKFCGKHGVSSQQEIDPRSVMERVLGKLA